MRGGLLAIPTTSLLSPSILGTRKHHSRANATTKTFMATSQLKLESPPYPLDALEPYLSRETLEHHWGGHHRLHVDALNKMVAGTSMEGMTLEDIMMKSSSEGLHAAQIWNHNFFWQSMKPGGGGKPSGRLMELIQRDFGSFENMLDEIVNAAMTQFGSGWVWLAYKANKLNVGNAVNPRPSEKDNKLVILKSPNALNPLVWDYSPILAIDVWEHAYCLDYENNKKEYASVFMEKLVSWEVVSSRLDVAIARAANRMQEDERKQDEDKVAADNEAVQMYLDSDNDETEAE